MEVAFLDTPEGKKNWNSMMNALKNGEKRYVVPSTLTDIFDKDSDPKVYYMQPKVNSNVLYKSKVAEIMKYIKQGVLSSAADKDLEYKKPMSDAEKTTQVETSARGKILIEYANDQQEHGKTKDPQQAMYRVWLEKNDYTEKWDAYANQKNGAESPVASPTPTPQPSVPEYRKTCATDAQVALSKDDKVVDDAIAAFCDKAKIDISSPVSKTHSGTSADGKSVEMKLGMRMSANQEGCKPVGANKSVPRIKCKTLLGYALAQCPNPEGTAFLGTRPLVWNSALGCIDVDIYW